MLRDHYLILGVPPDASAAEIRAAWRRQVRYWHPDRNPQPGAARRIQLLNLAHEVLSDPVQRSAYDEARLREDVTGDLADDADVPLEGAWGTPYDALDDDDWETSASAAPAPPRDDARLDVARLLARLDPLIREAEVLLSRPTDPSPETVARWAADAEALVERRLGRWHTYAQHLHMALMSDDARARLGRAQSILSAIRVDGTAGTLRPDAPAG